MGTPSGTTGMSWWVVLALAAGAYAFKALGLVVVGSRTVPPRLHRCFVLLPAALLSGLIVLQTFSDGRSLVLDARAVGVGAAAIAAWRRAPFPVVILIGAAVTAGVRALTRRRARAPRRPASADVLAGVDLGRRRRQLGR